MNREVLKIVNQVQWIRQMFTEVRVRVRVRVGVGVRVRVIITIPLRGSRVSSILSVRTKERLRPHEKVHLF